MMRQVFIIIFILSISFSAGISKAQEVYSGEKNSEGIRKQITIKEKPGHIYSTMMIKDSLSVIDIDMTEMVDVIVQYKDTPMFMQQKENKLSRPGTSSFISRQVQFSNDLTRLYETVNKAYSTTFSVPKKKAEYYKVFSGASMSVPKAMISAIASLPYVKKVSIDRVMKADLSESVKIIDATSVWNKYNNEGDSVVVGIIDTGIDYLHPALGKGFGKGFKVIGGYDFVNKDDDPMDDNGHGTHVAGIVAGNSNEIKGVAFKALLVAYKVLDSEGRGSESDVISAIERTVDPNGDNNFDDRLDVVNMSLGDDGGNSFDPVCDAVDNAVKLGVTFCIAAGNSGAYSGVASPGAAQLAITVGASDKSDILAQFSAKGPSKKIYAIKPEVLAPGVNIFSSSRGGGIINYSGTSMASPHVAGVCALIKHMHKDWTPEMIKSAVMTTAKDLGLQAMLQGSGRVNALKALEVTTFSSPALLNFGLDSLNNTLWTKKDTITILNKFDSPQNYNINIKGLISGINITSDHNSLVLQPGQSENVIFTLTVDNNTVPDVNSNSYSYSGRVSIIGDKDSLYLPWAFVKAPVLMISFAKPAYFYCIYGNEKTYTSDRAWNSYDPVQSEIILPAGTYSAFAIFTDFDNGIPKYLFVERSGFEVKGFKSISISPSDADKTISFNGVDESGRKLSSIMSSRNNLYLQKVTNFRFYTQPDFGLSFSTSPNWEFKMSSLSDNIVLYAGQFFADTQQENAVRLIQYAPVWNIKSDIEFKNLPSDLVRRNVSITLPEDGNSGAGFLNCFRIYYDYVNYISSDVKASSSEWKGTVYMTPDLNREYGFSIAAYSVKPSGGNVNWMSGHFRAVSNAIYIEPGIYYSPAVYFTKESEVIRFGDGPIYPYCYLGNNSTSTTAPRLEQFVSIFGQLNEQRMGDVNHSAYTIYDRNDQVLSSGNLFYGTQYISLPTGKFKYEFHTDNYTVAGVKGKARYYAEMDFTDTKKYVPQIASIQVLNPEGTPVSILKAGDKGKISFSVVSRDSLKMNIDSLWTRLYLKKNGTPDWEQIKISQRTNYNNTALINITDIGKYADTDSSLIDMKIITQNAVKQRIEWVLVPAFAVGDYKYRITDDNDYTVRIPTKDYVLYNNFPNPFNASTTISYGLPFRAHVDLRIYDMLGREITTLVNKIQDGGQYKIQFDAGSLSSGMYICRLVSGTYTKAQKILLVK